MLNQVSKRACRVVPSISFVNSKPNSCIARSVVDPINRPPSKTFTGGEGNIIIRHFSSDDNGSNSNVTSACPKCGGQLNHIREGVTSPRFVKCTQCCYFFVCDIDILSKDVRVESSCPELSKEETIPSPKEIYSFLNEYVIGQQYPKKVLSVGIYNHYKRMEINLSQKQRNETMITGVPTLDKTNVLMLGPTGAGKTLLAQTLAKCLQVPMTICDCTSLTQAGYVGEDVESVIAKLLIASDFNIEKCQRGIVFLDEVDKISMQSKDVHVRDISGEGVQQALLKLLEGTLVTIPERLIPSRKLRSEPIQIDTTNILFIASGAFSGIEKIVRNRKIKKRLGFGSPSSSDHDVGDNDQNVEKQLQINDKYMKDIEAEDLVAYGIIPEFIGRMPLTVPLMSLDKEALVSILTKPKNSIISQYKYLLSLDDCELIFTDESLEAIADLVIKRRSGARGLRSILENTLMETMFEVPGSDIVQITVTEETIVRGIKPEYKHQTDFQKTAVTL